MNKIIEEENGINVYYQEDYDTANLPLHFHYRHEIIFVIEGSSKFTINKKKYILQRNSILFISSLETHDFEILEYPYKRYIISMNNDFVLTMLKQPVLLSILLHRPANFCHSTNIGKYKSKKITRIFNKLLAEYKYKDNFWLVNIAALITVLLVTLYRYSSEIFPINTTSDSAVLVFDIQKHIAKNYQYRITLKVLSKEFFFSEYYISRIFKKVTGYNYKKYLIIYRLSIAKEMLINSKNTITEISALCGYRNINHFNRIFKSHVGMPPTKYRKLKSKQAFK